MSGYFGDPSFRSSNQNAKYSIKDQKTKAEEASEYDPYLHRKVEHPTTNAETFFHLLKGCIGTGILSMPYAFRLSGYLIGIIGIVIIAIIVTYCVHLLLRANYELCRRRKTASLTYPATAEAALEDGPHFFKILAPYAQILINIFLLVYQLGGLCIYTLFISKNIKDAADQHMQEIDLKIWMLIILLPLVLINCVRNLKYLAPFSTLANGVTVGSLAIILYYIFKEGITIQHRVSVGKLEDFPLYFGTVLFALSIMGVIVPLENEMKTPKTFVDSFGLLNMSMVIAVFLYMGMGVLGYLAYGDCVEETITLSIEKTEVLAQTIKILLALSIYVTHALQMYVAIDIVWNQYLNQRLEKKRFKLLYEFIVRTCLVLMTVCLPMAAPQLGLFVSLVGTFTNATLGLMFPAIINMSTFWFTLKGLKSYSNIIGNSVIILFGLIGLIVGCWISLKDIIETL